MAKKYKKGGPLDPPGKVKNSKSYYKGKLYNRISEIGTEMFPDWRKYPNRLQEASQEEIDRAIRNTNRINQYTKKLYLDGKENLARKTKKKLQNYIIKKRKKNKDISNEKILDDFLRGKDMKRTQSSYLKSIYGDRGYEGYAKDVALAERALLDAKAKMSNKRVESDGALTGEEFLNKLATQREYYKNRPVQGPEFQQYPLGGAIMAGLQFAPLILDLFGGNDNVQPNTVPMNTDVNPLMKMGGEISQDGTEFREYSLPSHNEGGGVIDSSLNLNPQQGVAELEKNETIVRNKGGDAYVYSDTLKGKNNKTFAELSKRIKRKYSRGTDIDKRSKDLELQMLRRQNDFAKEQAEQFQAMAQEAGDLPMAQFGLDLPLAIRSMASMMTPDNLQIMMQRKRLEDSQTPQSIDPAQQLPFVRSNKMINPMSPIDTSLKAPPRDMSLPNVKSLGTGYDSEPFLQGDGTTTASGRLKKPFNFNTVALGLKGAGLLHSLIDGLQKPEQDTRRYNLARPEAEGLMENRVINFRGLEEALDLGAQAGLDQARNVAGNAATQANLSNKVLNQSARQKAQLRLQEQQTNNQYRAQEAQMKSSLGAQERAYERETDIADMQNEANKRGFFRNFMSELSQVGSEFNKYQFAKEQMRNNKELADATIREGLTLLSGKYQNFGISKDMVTRLKSGDYDDDDFTALFDAMIKFKG